MSITISLPVEIESALRQRAAIVGTDVESFVRQIVLEEVTETPVATLGGEPHPDFVARLRGTIQRHRIHHGHFDDSRESIYAGRGE